MLQTVISSPRRSAESSSRDVFQSDVSVASGQTGFNHLPSDEEKKEMQNLLRLTLLLRLLNTSGISFLGVNLFYFVVLVKPSTFGRRFKCFSSEGGGI